MGTHVPPNPKLAHLLAIASAQYHQLVFGIAEADSTIYWQDTAAYWQDTAAALNGHYINLSLELSQRLLDIPQRQWPHRTMELIDAVVASAPSSELKVLHRIEILFDPQLQLDPLRSLQQISRRHCLLVAWPGTYDDRYLTYAEPAHPEYRRYPRKDLIVFLSA